MRKTIDRIKNFILVNYKWITFAIFIIIFLLITEDVLDNDITVFDTGVYNSLSNLVKSGKYTNIFKIITNLGGVIFLISLSVLLLIILKNKKISFYIILNLGIAFLVNHTIKLILQRPRPTGYNLIEENGYSFPSGHSMISMAFYGFLIYLIFKKIKDKVLKYLLITLLSIVILSVGLSRIYLGVHYASDVLAGFIIGLCYLIIFTSIIKTNK